MFELLGTPPADKKRLIYDRGHSVPKAELIRESVAWLDRYLGPVGILAATCGDVTPAAGPATAPLRRLDRH